MNHTTLAIVAMLAIAAALIGAVAAVSVPAVHAQSYTSNDNSKDPGKKNSIDYENSATNFSFKQKLKNNCSYFANCTNTAQEALAGIG